MSRLTGRTRFRNGAFGRVILQVEFIWHGIGPYERPSIEGMQLDRFDWRDAEALDLSNPVLRWVIDGPGD